MTTDADIQAFLRRFAVAAAAHQINIWRTRKNDQFLTDSGLTNQDVVIAIGTLRVRDYSGGPESRTTTSEVWKFSREYEGYDMYIKLGIDSQTGVPMAECLSFHEAEEPMPQPSRGRR